MEWKNNTEGWGKIPPRKWNRCGGEEIIEAETSALKPRNKNEVHIISFKKKIFDNIGINMLVLISLNLVILMVWKGKLACAQDEKLKVHSRFGKKFSAWLVNLEPSSSNNNYKEGLIVFIRNHRSKRSKWMMGRIKKVKNVMNESDSISTIILVYCPTILFLWIM